MDLHPDFRDLLEAFARCEVSFAIVGGYAVAHHAKPRATKDLDLLVSAEGDNLERVARGLTEFGAPQNVVDAARRLGASEVIYMGVAPVRIDLLRPRSGRRSLRLDSSHVVLPVPRGPKRKELPRGGASSLEYMSSFYGVF